MNAVIIGSGQTGRGFIAPILKDAGYDITFCDKNPQLVKQLNQEGSYKIRYYNNEQPERTISGFKAVTNEDALDELARADVITTSVFANNIPDLTDMLSKTVEKAKHKLTVICCENGVNVKKPLVDAGIDAVISEGIIFCTTVQPDKEKLDLDSQAYPDLPVDGSVEGIHLSIKGMPLEMHFSDLIHRKIYTYNFMSAVISYFGAYKKYEIYGEAANDPYIAAFTDYVTEPVSRVIGDVYRVAYEDQLQFTLSAVKKFRNKEIVDTIYRNARQADRKLGTTERILSPLRFTLERNIPVDYYAPIIATAMYYGNSYEGLNPDDVYGRLEEIKVPGNFTDTVKSMYQSLLNGKDLEMVYPLK